MKVRDSGMPEEESVVRIFSTRKRSCVPLVSTEG